MTLMNKTVKLTQYRCIAKTDRIVCDPVERFFEVYAFKQSGLISIDGKQIEVELPAKVLEVTKLAVGHSIVSLESFKRGIEDG